jgi:hypothetical protein
MLLAVATLEHPAPAGFSPFLLLLRATPADADTFYTPACAALAGVEPQRALRVQQLAELAVSPDQQEAISAAVLLLPELRDCGILVPSLSSAAPACNYSPLPDDASATCDTLLKGMRETIKSNFLASKPTMWSQGRSHLLLAEAESRTAVADLRTSKKQVHRIYIKPATDVPKLGPGSSRVNTMPKTEPKGLPLPFLNYDAIHELHSHYRIQLIRSTQPVLLSSSASTGGSVYA